MPIFFTQLSTELSAKHRHLQEASSQLEKLLGEIENGRAELKSLDQALGAQRTALAVANRAADKRKEETKALNKEAEELLKGMSSLEIIWHNTFTHVGRLKG